MEREWMWLSTWSPPQDTRWGQSPSLKGKAKEALKVTKDWEARVHIARLVEIVFSRRCLECRYPFWLLIFKVYGYATLASPKRMTFPKVERNLYKIWLKCWIIPNDSHLLLAYFGDQNCYDCFKKTEKWRWRGIIFHLLKVREPLTCT